MHLKVGFVGFAPGVNIDGGSIYDKKFCDSLRSLGCELECVYINRVRNRLPPFWLSQVTVADIKKTTKLKENCELLIISHEGLAGLASRIKPSLFILHNVFSSFEFSSKKHIEWYYRINSLSVYKNILKFSNNVLTISKRETDIITDLRNDLNSEANIISEPPGLKFELNDLDFEYSKIKIPGTHNWYPKKICRLTENEKRLLEKDSKSVVTNEEFINPSFAIIEEKFKVGFKLKLIQMLYRGDCVASLIPLDEEVNWIFPNCTSYFNVKTVDEALDVFENQEPKIRLQSKGKLNISKRMVELNYSWDAIVLRVLKSIV